MWAVGGGERRGAANYLDGERLPARVRVTPARVGAAGCIAVWNDAARRRQAFGRALGRGIRNM
jgi:hypothetical protein